MIGWKRTFRIKQEKNLITMMKIDIQNRQIWESKQLEMDSMDIFVEITCHNLQYHQWYVQSMEPIKTHKAIICKPWAASTNQRSFQMEKQWEYLQARLIKDILRDRFTFVTWIDMKTQTAVSGTFVTMSSKRPKDSPKHSWDGPFSLSISLCLHFISVRVESHSDTTLMI